MSSPHHRLPVSYIHTTVLLLSCPIPRKHDVSAHNGPFFVTYEYVRPHAPRKEHVSISTALSVRGLPPQQRAERKQLDGDSIQLNTRSSVPSLPPRPSHKWKSAPGSSGVCGSFVRIMTRFGDRQSLGQSWPRLKLLAETLDAHSSWHLGHRETHLSQWHPAYLEMVGSLQ